jgi:hypothetical protein
MPNGAARQNALRHGNFRNALSCHRSMRGTFGTLVAPFIGLSGGRALKECQPCRATRLGIDSGQFVNKLWMIWSPV